MALLDPIVNAPRSQKIVLGLVPLAAILALGYFLVISPKQMERDALTARLQDLQAQVTKGQADEANIRQVRIQAEALSKRLDAAKERLPTERELPRLYRQITDLAAQSEVQVALFQVKKPEDRSVYQEIPITFNAEAPYHKVGTFFERLGRLPRVVTLEDFRLLQNDKPTGSVRAELTLSTYVLRADTPPPGPAGAPKPGAPAPAATPPAPAPPAAAPGAKR
jgi:type IV pilus assembly protein PilO